MAAALLVFALGASSAEAAKPKKPKHFYYLALGDSISYGYSLVKFDENLGPCEHEGPTGTNCEPPSAFEPGLENYVFGLVKVKKGKTTIKPSKKESTINLSCPAETSSGLIGHKASFGGGAGAEFNPCGWHNSSGFRRHYEYGSASQLEAAAGLIASNPEAVNLVSLQIGSNDELHVLGECRSEAYRVAHSYADEAACVAGEAPGLFAKILSNMGHTVGVLRASGYKGTIVILGFYNPFGVLVHSTDALQVSLNEHLEETVSHGMYGPGVKVANPFATFNGPADGGAGEKAALTTNTEFYNPAAIADELAGITKSEEINHHPNLAEATAFTEAYGQCSAKLGTKTHRFEDALCTTENALHEGEYERVNPNLAEVLAFEEAHASPANLAEETAFHEVHGHPNLAEVTAAEEAAHLAAVTAAEEAAHLAAVTAAEEAKCTKVPAGLGKFESSSCTTEGAPNEWETALGALTASEEAAHLAATEAFCEAHGCNGGHSLAEEDTAAEAAFFHNCEVTEAKEKAVCEAEWTGGAQVATEEAVDTAFDAAVKAGFDHEVKVGFDAAVKAGFDAAVKAGFDAAVKGGFDHAVKVAFDAAFEFFFKATVKHAFDETVKAGFEAAGSPGDIHPSKAGYAVLGNLIKANK